MAKATLMLVTMTSLVVAQSSMSMRTVRVDTYVYEPENEEECLLKYSNTHFDDGVVACKTMYDSFLCWPPAQANTILEKRCPKVRLSDPSSLAHRTCGENGQWLGRYANDSNVKGWTNFTLCVPSEFRTMFEEIFRKKNNSQTKYDIASNVRTLEIAGFALSAVALMLSIYIFAKFRALKNEKTIIHKCNFGTMLFQAIIRLTIYGDQIYTNNSGNSTTIGLFNTQFLCIGGYILLEYSITAMFFWMLVEGFYLNKLVSRSTMRVGFFYKTYCYSAWGVPFVVTSLWATFNGMEYARDRIKTCWYGYNFHITYWILQIPRIGVIIVNFCFLLNIMITIIQKLKRSRTSELEKTMKAVRAALILLPLLGITNILDMIELPTDVSNFKFALWNYGTHFMRSFQGLFVSLIYCFFNGEVQAQLSRKFGHICNRHETTREDNTIGLRDLQLSGAQNRNQRAVETFRRTVDRLAENVRSQAEMHNYEQEGQMESSFNEESQSPYSIKGFCQIHHTSYFTKHEESDSEE